MGQSKKCLDFFRQISLMQNTQKMRMCLLCVWETFERKWNYWKDFCINCECHFKMNANTNGCIPGAWAQSFAQSTSSADQSQSKMSRVAFLFITLKIYTNIYYLVHRRDSNESVNSMHYFPNYIQRFELIIEHSIYTIHWDHCEPISNVFSFSYNLQLCSNEKKSSAFFLYRKEKHKLWRISRWCPFVFPTNTNIVRILHPNYLLKLRFPFTMQTVLFFLLLLFNVRKLHQLRYLEKFVKLVVIDYIKKAIQLFQRSVKKWYKSYFHELGHHFTKNQRHSKVR